MAHLASPPSPSSSTAVASASASAAVDDSDSVPVRRRSSRRRVLRWILSQFRHASSFPPPQLSSEDAPIVDLDAHASRSTASNSISAENDDPERENTDSATDSNGQRAARRSSSSGVLSLSPLLIPLSISDTNLHGRAASTTTTTAGASSSGSGGGGGGGPMKSARSLILRSPIEPILEGAPLNEYSMSSSASAPLASSSLAGNRASVSGSPLPGGSGTTSMHAFLADESQSSSSAFATTAAGTTAMATTAATSSRIRKSPSTYFTTSNLLHGGQAGVRSLKLRYSGFMPVRIMSTRIRWTQEPTDAEFGPSLPLTPKTAAAAASLSPRESSTMMMGQRAPVYFVLLDDEFLSLYDPVRTNPLLASWLLSDILQTQLDSVPAFAVIPYTSVPQATSLRPLSSQPSPKKNAAADPKKATSESANATAVAMPQVDSKGLAGAFSKTSGYDTSAAAMKATSDASSISLGAATASISESSLNSAEMGGALTPGPAVRQDRPIVVDTTCTLIDSRGPVIQLLGTVTDMGKWQAAINSARRLFFDVLCASAIERPLLSATPPSSVGSHSNLNSPVASPLLRKSSEGHHHQSHRHHQHQQVHARRSDDFHQHDEEDEEEEEEEVAAPVANIPRSKSLVVPSRKHRKGLTTATAAGAAARTSSTVPSKLFSRRSSSKDPGAPQRESLRDMGRAFFAQSKRKFKFSVGIGGNSDGSSSSNAANQEASSTGTVSPTAAKHNKGTPSPQYLPPLSPPSRPPKRKGFSGKRRSAPNIFESAESPLDIGPMPSLSRSQDSLAIMQGLSEVKRENNDATATAAAAAAAVDTAIASTAFSERVVRTYGRPSYDRTTMRPRSLSLTDLYDIDSNFSGTGSSAFVKSGVSRDNGIQVAVKFVAKQHLKQLSNDGLPFEVETLKCLSHPNIVRLFGVYESNHFFCLVMERIGRGEDLFSYLEEKGSLPVPEAQIIFKQVVAAVAYLAANNLFHGDIKDENVIIDRDAKIVKLIDFGSAQDLMEAMPCKNFKGTLPYVCPEIVTQQTFNPMRQEVWALGNLLCSLVAGGHPFRDTNEIVRMSRVSDAIPAEILSGLSPLFVDLLNKMMAKFPAEAIPFSALLSHPWFL